MPLLPGKYVRANGDESTGGWAHNPQIEAEIAAWYNATRLDEDKTIMRQLNKLAIDHVLDAPLGVAPVNSARRKTVSGIVQAPLPLF